VTDVKVLDSGSQVSFPSYKIVRIGLLVGLTLMPSSEKQGGTAELSSSASFSRIGNFSTADMGISPL
jgi:hypothetical protein